MITMLDLFLIFLTSIFLLILSLTMIILPFTGLDKQVSAFLYYNLRNLQSKYIISVIGVVVLAMSLKLFSILFRKKNNKNDSLYINQWTDYGEIKISANTVIGLVKSVSEKFTGLRNINVGTRIFEGNLFIEIEGETSPETNIPEMIEQLQKKVKSHIETCTGVGVEEVKVYITNVSQPVRNLR